MLTVSALDFTNRNIQNQKSKISFQATPNAIDSKLSIKAKKLVKRASTYIEETWTDIRKGKTIIEEPKFACSLGKHKFAELRPIYNGKKSMLIEISDDKYIENIIIDREKQNHFIYEKKVLTDHGCATLKSYNSKTDNNIELEEHINSEIEKSLTEILPKVTMRQLLEC